MTKDALKVLEGLKFAQITEDGEVYMDFKRCRASTCDDIDAPSQTFNFSEYKTSIESILLYLAGEGLIRKKYIKFEYLCVTHAGWHYAEQLAAEEHARLEQARKEAKQLTEERAKEKRNKVFDVFLVLLGSALTLLFEHFSAIAEFIAGLFGK